MWQVILLTNTITQFIGLLRRNQSTLHLILMLNTMKVLTKNPKFKVGEHVRISKHINVFAKGYTQKWSEEVFIIRKIKNTVPWTYFIRDIVANPLLELFMKKN